MHGLYAQISLNRIYLCKRFSVCCFFYEIIIIINLCRPETNYKHIISCLCLFSGTNFAQILPLRETEENVFVINAACKSKEFFFFFSLAREYFDVITFELDSLFIDLSFWELFPR